MPGTQSNREFKSVIRIVDTPSVKPVGDAKGCMTERGRGNAGSGGHDAPQLFIPYGLDSAKRGPRRTATMRVANPVRSSVST